MDLRVASYNIRKAVGRDRRRDPDRIIAILAELDADVVALQEADRRFGSRASVLPRDALAHAGWHPAPLAMKASSLGWHGNALLVRDHVEFTDCAQIDLPTLEPRGAVRADLAIRGQRVRVAGMHLDLTGIRRRQQVRSVLAHLRDCDGDCPAILMGDLNEWLPRKGALRAFGSPETYGDWQVLAPGKSYPAGRPLGNLDRIVVSDHWQVRDTGVHASEDARWGSDHLPVYANLHLPKK